MAKGLHRLFFIAALLCSAGSVASAQTAPNPNVQAACRGDVQRLCHGVQPGGGQIAKCLKAHLQQVSAGCQQAYAAARQERGQAQPPPPPPPRWSRGRL